MLFKRKYTEDKIPNSLEWKEKNKKYLNQLQKFLDATDSIEKEELRNHIIAQMLKCDKILTDLAISEIQKCKVQMYKVQEKDTY